MPSANWHSLCQRQGDVCAVYHCHCASFAFSVWGESAALLDALLAVVAMEILRLWWSSHLSPKGRGSTVRETSSSPLFSSSRGSIYKAVQQRPVLWVTGRTLLPKAGNYEGDGGPVQVAIKWSYGYFNWERQGNAYFCLLGRVSPYRVVWGWWGVYDPCLQWVKHDTGLSLLVQPVCSKIQTLRNRQCHILSCWMTLQTLCMSYESQDNHRHWSENNC